MSGSAKQYLDATGNTYKETDGLGHTVFQNTINSRGWVTASEDGLGNTTTYTLDKEGRTLTETDPTNQTTSFTLDALGRTVKTEDANSNVTQSVYNADGQAVVSLDGSSQPAFDIPNPVGQQTYQIDALSGITQKKYDANGNLVSLTDPDGNTTTWEYNFRNELIKETGPNGHSTTFAYDNKGRETGRTDRLGREIDTTYYDNGLVHTKVWKDTSGTTVNTQTFTYNKNDQVLTAADDNSSYTLTYDAQGRVATVQEPWGLSLTFSYDAANNRTKVEDSLGGVISSTYDNANNLTKREFDDGTTQARVDLGYTSDNQLSDITRYSDLAGTSTVATTSISYDAGGRIDHLQHKDGSGTNIANYTYTYRSSAATKKELDGRRTASIGMDVL